MDEYTVLVDGVVRDALGLDGARGAGDAPAEALTAPASPAWRWNDRPSGHLCMGPVCDLCGRAWGASEEGPSPAGE